MRGLIKIFLASALMVISISSLAKNHGIEIKSVRLSAAGYMLDVRYRVTDKTKASHILMKGLKPYIIEEKTGAKLYVPAPAKIGPLRQIAKDYSKERTYFMMFANPGKRLKAGDKISVVLGDFKAQHQTVK